MSAQRVGAKWLRRLRQATGRDVLMGWAHGGYHINFVTAEHLHGCFDMKAYRRGDPQPWEWYPRSHGFKHYSPFCRDMFGDDRDGPELPVGEPVFRGWL